MYEKIKSITSFIRTKIGDFSPRIGIVLGSGLGDLADRISDPVYLLYEDIEGFPRSTVKGHNGRFVFGLLGGVKVVCMQGRFHFYEGWSISEVVMGMRVMGMLGITSVIVSNAAGGVGQGLNVGDVMLISDQINMLPNPLIGANEDRFGERFPTMVNAYEDKLRDFVKQCGVEQGLELKEGVYLGGTGPSYETVAEYKFFRAIGAHACGMSTTAEVIVAAHMGIKVLGFSVITNAPFANNAYTDHAEVQQVASGVAEKMGRLIETALQTGGDLF